MSTITTVINVCDRCGSQHNAADYMKGNEWGHLSVAWSGDKGGRSYQGDAAGFNIKGKAWLCLPCTNAFEAFMKPTQRGEVMSTHTAGPWAVQCDPLHFHTMSSVVGGEMCSGFPDRRLIVEVGGSAPPDEQEANTRLVAAAPDLLEAAKQALLHIEGDEMTHGRPFSAGNMLRAAIAKPQPTLPGAEP